MSLEAMDYWRLSGSLSAINSAILITGNDPSKKRFSEGYDQSPELIQCTDYEGFDAAYESVKDAILTNELAALVAFLVGEPEQQFGHQNPRKLIAVLGRNSKAFQLRGLKFYNQNSLIFLHDEPDWTKTMIRTADLKVWLQSKGIYPSFFFPQGAPDSFMNKDHPRYSGKLACSVAAWRAVRHAAKSKTPKQTIEAWVTANGVNFGLVNEDGVVPGTAIEEISKVVNWQTKGGVARSGGTNSDEPENPEPDDPQNYIELEIIQNKFSSKFDEFDNNTFGFKKRG